ncbi:hypothetical protein [Haliangium sp.]|uniref:hypothetical protein n=1 Tax=Haliangium sp. TaxID=2663208 RepID=UPI003D0C2F83
MPRNPSDPPSDLRVGDLLSGHVADDELDPETRAQLAAWFGPPGAVPTPKPSAGVGPRPARTALEGVDPGFLDTLERKWRDHAPLVGVREQASIAATTSATTRSPCGFDIDAWSLPAPADDERSYDRPEDISDDLKESVPQAVLRDLHRPEQQWPLRLLPQDMGLDVAGAEASEQIRTVLAHSLMIRMDDEPVPARLMADDMNELRSRLRDESWEASYVPPEQRAGTVSYLPTAEDLKWFGMVGFDPDL